MPNHINGIDLGDRHNQIAFIGNPIGWPSWPFLPLKRQLSRHSNPELGILMSNDPRTILLCNMFEAPRTKAELEKIAKLNYDSVEAIINDGWIID